MRDFSTFFVIDCWSEARSSQLDILFYVDFPVEQFWQHLPAVLFQAIGFLHHKLSLHSLNSSRAGMNGMCVYRMMLPFNRTSRTGSVHLCSCRKCLHCSVNCTVLCVCQRVISNKLRERTRSMSVDARFDGFYVWFHPIRRTLSEKPPFGV